MIRELCAGKTPAARKCFWSIVSSKVKQSADISAVVDPITGVLQCGIDEIKSAVEDHLASVFQGSFEPIDVPFVATSSGHSPDPIHDHTYGVKV